MQNAVRMFLRLLTLTRLAILTGLAKQFVFKTHLKASSNHGCNYDSNNRSLKRHLPPGAFNRTLAARCAWAGGPTSSQGSSRIPVRDTARVPGRPALPP